jgi:hypothetical protein
MEGWKPCANRRPLCRLENFQILQESTIPLHHEKHEITSMKLNLFKQKWGGELIQRIKLGHKQNKYAERYKM